MEIPKFSTREIADYLFEEVTDSRANNRKLKIATKDQSKLEIEADSSITQDNHDRWAKIKSTPKYGIGWEFIQGDSTTQNQYHLSLFFNKDETQTEIVRIEPDEFLTTPRTLKKRWYQLIYKLQEGVCNELKIEAQQFSPKNMLEGKGTCGEELPTGLESLIDNVKKKGILISDNSQPEKEKWTQQVEDNNKRLNIELINYNGELEQIQINYFPRKISSSNQIGYKMCFDRSLGRRQIELYIINTPTLTEKKITCSIEFGVGEFKTPKGYIEQEKKLENSLIRETLKMLEE